MSKDSIQKQLERGRILVFGIAENAEVKQKIAPIYSEERIEQGKQKYLLAKEGIANQFREGSEAKTAHIAFKDKYEEGILMVGKLRKVGRYFFSKDIEKYNLLCLNQEKPHNYAEWRDWALGTVNAIVDHEEIQEKYTLAAFPVERITRIKSDLENLDHLRLNWEKEDGEAQQSTIVKQNAFDDFMAYCRDLRACLDLFYEGDARQKLEEVGIVVK
jgi:hypothetical protein